jgi:hypothetical protein
MIVKKNDKEDLKICFLNIRNLDSQQILKSVLKKMRLIKHLEI